VPTIRSREVVDFYIGGGRNRSVRLAGLTYPHETVACTGHNPKTFVSVAFDEDTHFETGIGGTLSFSCVRQGKRDSTGNKHFDAADIVVKTTEGNYGIYLPSDMLPALPTATSLNRRIDQLAASIPVVLTGVVSTPKDTKLGAGPDGDRWEDVPVYFVPAFKANPQ